jgi:hypothetical protein
MVWGVFLPHLCNPLKYLLYPYKVKKSARSFQSGMFPGIPWIIITDDLCYPAHQTPFQSHFDPMRVGRRAGQDLLNDTPRLFIAALVFFPDNIYGKPNTD